ncbi:MAG: hypothetical protein U0638_08040 [Phycisphaerales bacterium]
MTRRQDQQLGRGCVAMIAAAVAAVGACAVLVACGSDTNKSGAAAKDSSTKNAADTSAGAKSFRGAMSGLETQTWLVNDTTGEVGRALAAYAAAGTPAKTEQVRLWRAAGLRVVAIPDADVEKTASLLSLMGTRQRRWNGELSAWTPIVAGPAWEGDRELSIATGAALLEREALKLAAGRMRLLARAYATPVLAGEALESRLKIELAPQHEEPDSSARALQRQLSGVTDARQRGMMFRQLALEFVARPGECYIITGDAPEMDWVSDSERSNDAPGPEMSRESRVEGPPTLGEAMLTDVNSEGTVRRRVILVLVPRTEGTFTLTGR